MKEITANDSSRLINHFLAILLFTEQSFSNGKKYDTTAW